MTAARSYWPSEETTRRRDTPGMALGFSNLVPGIQITLSCLSSRYNARTCLSDSLCPTLTTVIPSCLHTEYSLVSEGTSKALVASSRTKKIQKTSDGRTVFVCFLSAVAWKRIISKCVSVDHNKTIENGDIFWQKQRLSKTLSIVEIF